MTNNKQELNQKYSKALLGGLEMLNRAKFLEEKGLELVRNSEEESPDWRHGLAMQAFAWEMRGFYEKMFN